MSDAMASIRESAVWFDCAGERLVGIVAEPEQPGPVAVLIVVGGPQYRAGSHRQFVLLARRLAQAGHAAMRFDVRGMGDSGGDPRTFEGLCDDIGAAVDALLARCPRAERVALWGLCDGASAALLYLQRTADPRIVGLCLVNPWVRSEASLARTHVRHYYGRRLLEAGFWAKLLSGQVALGALKEAAASARLAWRTRRAGRAHSREGTWQERMAAAWHAFDGPLLLVLSTGDYTAREFADQLDAGGCWQAAWSHPRLQRLDVEGADHTFSDARHRRQVEDATAGWLATSDFATAGPTAPRLIRGHDPGPARMAGPG